MGTTFGKWKRKADYPFGVVRFFYEWFCVLEFETDERS